MKDVHEALKDAHRSSQPWPTIDSYKMCKCFACVLWCMHVSWN